MYAVREKLLDVPCTLPDVGRCDVHVPVDDRADTVGRRRRSAGSQARRIALAAQGFRDPRHARPTMRTFAARWRASGCSRSTRSTCCSARTTCRCSPGWVPTTSTCCAAPPSGGRAGWSSTGRTSRRSCRSSSGRYMQHRMRHYRERGHDWVGIRHDDALVSSRARRGPRAWAVDGPRPRRRAAADAGPLGLELVRDQEGARVPLRRRRARRAPGATAQFERVYDLPERVLPAAVLDAPTPTDTERARRAGPARRHRSRRRHRAVPARLLPAAARADASRRSRRWSSHGELLPVRDRGVEPAGLPAPRRRASRARCRHGPC